MNRTDRPVRAGRTGSLILCNVIVPQLLWFKKRAHERRRCCSSSAMFVNVGMWLERFVIIVDEPAPRLPAVVVGHVLPDVWDCMTFIGTIGLFLTLFFLFVRVLPMISIFEMRRTGSGRQDTRREGALSGFRPWHTPLHSRRCTA